MRIFLLLFCWVGLACGQETMPAITNGVNVVIEAKTNLISVGKFYPNGIEPPYILHHPQVVSNHTLIWMYRIPGGSSPQRFEHTFYQQFGPIDTNVLIKTPITSP